jgi:hypothetical protein
VLKKVLDIDRRFIDAFLCDSAVILPLLHFTAETQGNQRYAEKISKVGYYLVGRLFDAPKTVW